MKHLRLTEEIQEQACLYASGAGPEDERRDYARHLEEDDCAICSREVLELQSAVNLLAFSLPSKVPSPAVKARLMAQAESAAVSARVEPVPRRRWALWTAGLTAMASLVLVVLVLQDNAELRRLAESLSAELAQARSEMNQQHILVASLTSPNARVVDLAGQGATAAARGRIFWDGPQQRLFFFVHNLPPVPDSRSYQLWFVPKTGNPVSAKVFNTLQDGSVNVELPFPDGIGALSAAAVTTEPAGGSPLPTATSFDLLGKME